MSNGFEWLIKEYQADLVIIDKQITLMRRISCKYRHNKRLRELAVENLGLLTQERAELCTNIGYYLNIGKKQSESVESVKSGENQSFLQD